MSTVPPRLPHWQLPPGVTRGLWDYVHSDAIADDYDHYFADNRLFAFDEQVVIRRLPRRAAHGQWIADLGCGTGRALVALARHGFRGLAIDLSERMLAIVRKKAAVSQLPIQTVRANLVELDGIGDGAVDHAISLFSTLGMIRGRENRQKVLEHVRRIVKPGGMFILHVHNFYYNLFDPGGPRWMIRNLIQARLTGKVEIGDKFFAYRGLANMFLHVFTRRELTTALKRAGFQIVEMIPLDPRRHRSLRWPWLLGNWRANGWIVVCR